MRATEGCETVKRRRGAFRQVCQGKRRSAFRGRTRWHCSKRWKVYWYRVVKINYKSNGRNLDWWKYS